MSNEFIVTNARIVLPGSVVDGTVHEHASAPFDVESGKALLDLRP